MERPTVPLRRDVYQRWSQLQAFVGIPDTSDFADHLINEYKTNHNIPSEGLSVPAREGDDGIITNGITVKLEMVAGESCDSADTSGKASPDLDYLRPKDKPPNRKRKQRSFLGLESVVQRLHQAKGKDDGPPSDKDESKPEYAPTATSPSPSTGWQSTGAIRSGGEGSSPPPVKQEWLSLEEYTYSSSRIVPEPQRSLQTAADDTQGLAPDAQGLPPNGHQDTSSSSLRRLLERPAVNASAELRRNAAELKERGVVINPAMYERGSPPPYEAHRHPGGDGPPAAQALDSLIRMALQTKGKGGVPTEEELLHAALSRGGTVKEAQMASFQVPHPPVNETSNSSPALKSILQQGGVANYIPSGLSAQDEGQLGDRGKPAAAYNMPSAAFALQHLANMRGPESVPVVTRTIPTENVVPSDGQKLPKRTYAKRQKQPGGKPRRKHKSGSKKKNASNPPTVKNLLDEKKASPTKYRGRTNGAKEGKHKNRGRKRSKEGHSTTGKKARKKMKAGKSSPAKGIADVRTASPAHTLIDITHSAPQGLQMIPGHETAPPIATAATVTYAGDHDPRHSEKISQVASGTPISQTLHQEARIFVANNPAPPSAFLSLETTRGRSPSLTHSASEVMKLLASQNLPQSPLTRPMTGAPGQQPDLAHLSPLRQVTATHPLNDIPGKPFSGMAGIMKQLASNYSQSSDSGYPSPGAMFCSPAAGDSSTAFSLMKELITKGSS